MTSERSKKDWVPTMALVVSALAMVGTSINACSALNNSETQRESARIALETQKTALFSQFQQRYSDVRARFPDRVDDPTFKPPFGTEEYSRLEAYWLFCFSEWYATKRLSPEAYGVLWETYYSPLIMNAMETPSLHYALEVMIERFPQDRGHYRDFFVELVTLAQLSGSPLSLDTQLLLEAR